MLIGLYHRKIPVDLILFSNTGGEQPHTYDFLPIMDRWLEDHGLPTITQVEYTDRNGDRLTLEQECLRSGTLPAIAYGYKKCSLKHKIQPQDKFCNNYPPCREVWARGERVVKFIGLDCVTAIQQEGLPLPGKSSCFFCPSMKKREIRTLYHQHRDLYDRAIAIEDGARPNLITVKGLGRDWAWRDFVEADLNQTAMCWMFPEDDLPCNCHDGG